MKKLIFLALIGALFVGSANAQLRDTLVNPPGGALSAGQYMDLFGYQSGSGFSVVTNPVDSMQVSDTLVNVIPVLRTGTCWPYLTLYWNKVGAGTATLTVSFKQGNDPTNCIFPVLKGVNDSAYARTYTLSANTWNEIDFRRDTALFSGRYLYIRLQTTATASVGGKVYARLKMNSY